VPVRESQPLLHSVLLCLARKERQMTVEIVITVLSEKVSYMVIKRDLRTHCRASCSTGLGAPCQGSLLVRALGLDATPLELANSSFLSSLEHSSLEAGRGLMRTAY
jgi:hypothetical protein